MLDLLITVTAPVQDPDKSVDTAHYRVYAQSQLSPKQWKCLDELWDRESSWRTHKKPWRAKNKSSGAFGIPQALPASKMYSAGMDAMTNPVTQVKWGLAYIKQRYSSAPKDAGACNALRHHDRKGWY